MKYIPSDKEKLHRTIILTDKIICIGQKEHFQKVLFNTQK